MVLNLPDEAGDECHFDAPSLAPRAPNGVRDDLGCNMGHWRPSASVSSFSRPQTESTPLDAATAAYFQYSHTLGAFLAGSLSFGSILADGGATPGVE